MGDWLLIGIRFALYLTLTVLFGLSTFGFYGLRGDGHGNAIALRPWLAQSARSCDFGQVEERTLNA